VVAPAGTVVVIRVGESMVNTAGVPLKLTLVVPIRSVPRIWITAPTWPTWGSVSTNGPSPTDNLKSVPVILKTVPRVGPANVVVPY